MPQKIKLYVSNTATYISEKPSPEVYQKLRKSLGYRPEDAIFKMKKTKWDGIESTLHFNEKSCKCSIKKKGIHFPTGLLRIVREVFKSYNIEYEIYDTREEVKKTLSLEYSKEFEERDYQLKIIKDAVERQRGIIKVATGGGKTILAAGIIKEVGVSPFIFYVPSIDLMRQTQKEFSKFLIKDGKNLEVGMIGDQEFDIKDVTIMTTQTAVRACGGKYVEFDEEEKKEEENPILIEKRKDILSLIQSAKGLIADECQHWASETAQIIADNSISARYRWAQSATPVRDKNDDILIDACFGKEICNISATFLINHPKKYLVQPDIYLIPFSLGMPKEDLYIYSEYYRAAIVENIQRNKYIAKIAKEFRDQGRTVLILCQQIDHGKMIENLIEGSVFLHGEHSSEERKNHLDKMRKKEAGITIASQILDEGVDIRALDTLILSGGGKSKVRALQRVGRTLRSYISPSGQVKDGAIIVDIQDTCKYMRDHAKKREKMYRTESAFNIIKMPEIR